MNAPYCSNLFFGLILVAMLCTWGCSEVFYLPNAMHMPMLGEKNDFDVNLSTRFNEGGQFDLQSAYAPINHFAVMLNGMSSRSSYGTDHDKEFRFVEAGAGVFHTFGDKDKDNPFRVELMGGYGLGVGKNHDGGYKSIGRYHRKFLQPSFGVKLKSIEAGFGLRISEVNFSNYSIYQDGQLTERDILDFTTIERCFRVAAGFKGVKFGMQVSQPWVVRNQAAYDKATGASYNKSSIDFSLGFSPWKYRVPEGTTYRLHAEDSLGSYPMEFIINDSPCWVCLPKEAPYNDLIDFKLNGNEVGYSSKLSAYNCHRLVLSRKGPNLLSIILKKPTDTLSTPVYVLLIDGKLKRPFYIDLSGDKRMDIYLTY